MVKKTIDLTAFGILILSIWVFVTIVTKEIGFVGIVGLVGSTILIIVEGYFLFEKWLRK